MPQSISIQTLGDLVAHDHCLSAMCEKCRHRTDLDMQSLIARLGTDFRYVGRTVDRRLVCSQCGGKTVSVQVHYLYAGCARPAE